MTEKKNSEPDLLFTLSEETLKNLEAIGTELDEAEKGLEAMDELGMDTSRLRERIAWGKKARKVILERFAGRGK